MSALAPKMDIRWPIHVRSRVMWMRENEMPDYLERACDRDHVGFAEMRT